MLWKQGHGVLDSSYVVVNAELETVMVVSRAPCRLEVGLHEVVSDITPGCSLDL